MTAQERGMEMMNVKMKDLPPLALAYAKNLAGRVGGCMEVFLTAYTTYAQIVEGLPCDDSLYIPDAEERAIFAQLQQEQAALAPRSTTPTPKEKP